MPIRLQQYAQEGTNRFQCPPFAVIAPCNEYVLDKSVIFATSSIILYAWRGIN